MIQNMFVNKRVSTRVTRHTVCLCPSKVGNTSAGRTVALKEERGQSKICIQTYI